MAIFLVGVVFYEVALIRGAGGHNDFNFAAIEVVAVPVGAEFDNGIVKVGSYLTAEGDDHAFATNRTPLIIDPKAKLLLWLSRLKELGQLVGDEWV